ncbi:hypothetical protein [Kitasatospora sp. NPDC059817]
MPVLRWRSAAEVVSGRLLSPDEVPKPYESDDEYVPRPCLVHPTETVE